MTETVQVLTVPERLMTAAVAAVLAAATVSAAAVGPTPSAPSSATAAASPAAVEPAPKPSPSAAPATKAPAPVPAVQPAPKPPAAAPPEPPQAGCPLPKREGGPWKPKPRKPPVVAEADLPAPIAPGPKAKSLDPVAGKGIWVTNFAEDPVDVPGIVAKAKAAGLRSIWVRTGGKQGYYGHQFLPELVPAAHAAGLAVVAWDFPYLSDPVADAQRARQAFADGIDAFAPDIETEFEGTYATARRVEVYLSLVRSYAGEKPIAATVPRPTPMRRKSFPYRSFVAYSDLFVPMVYWSCYEPGKLVQQSLAELGRLLPVHPVGQGYDMGDEGGRRGTPTQAETWRFLDVAHRGGAVGASLWTVERMGPGQMEALRDYPWTRTP